MTTNKKPTPKQLLKLKDDIVRFLCERDMWIDVSIYVNRSRFTDHDDNHYYYNDPTHIVEEKNINPKDYFDYIGEDLLCMAFEGPLYHLLNYGDFKTIEKFEKLFEKYGLYYELGDAWNLSTAAI